MNDPVRIVLQPLGQTLEVERGSPLQDVLFEFGVEFPCGGQAACKGCRVKLLSGRLPATPDERFILTPEEIESGWRLACRSAAEEDLTLEIEQWETVILGDDRAFVFTPLEGLGVAVDLGTTTLVAQLVDLASGHVLGVQSAVNPQVAHGGDVMSRVQFSLSGGGAAKLCGAIRDKVGELIGLLSPPAAIRDVVIVGNTVMHNLFCGIDARPLSYDPFRPLGDGLEIFRGKDLGWSIEGDPRVRFLPCLGGFVGSDILAGVLATRMHESEALSALIDLGTNGEIVIGNRERMVCASTAAGPAFEGGRIAAGMRAATGAISEVHVDEGRLRCHVIGHTEPRGICGSGLVDAVAAGLDLGVIGASGRLSGVESPWMLAPPVGLTQSDVRELQLAKAAIAAGVRILVRRWGAEPRDVTSLHLAGAFGNYVSRGSARRIGLIDFPLERVQPAGNTALLGAKLALFSRDAGGFEQLRRRIEHIPLAADPEFQDIYVEEMRFPEATAD